MHEVCITHRTQGTAWEKQEEETDTRIMQESSKKSRRKERGHEGEKSQTWPN